MPRHDPADPSRRRILARDGIVDPDVDLHDPAQREETRPREWDLLLTVAVGGVLGAEARYGIATGLPSSGSAFPWATVVTNISGCLLIGLLMSFLATLARPRRLLRPFLGVGVLGGYTTYSTFAVDAERLLRAGRALAALGYVTVTVVGCAVAVVLGSLPMVRRDQREPVDAGVGPA